MYKKNAFHILALAALLSSAALATNTATSNMSTSGSVTNNCIISAGALTFGAYDPIVTNITGVLNGTATLAVSCTNGASAAITLGQGSNSDTGSTDAAPLRRLKVSTDYLTYTLWQDSGRSLTVWGNDADTGESYTGTGSSTNVTVYAKIAGGQTSAHAGSYTDTVVATITF